MNQKEFEKQINAIQKKLGKENSSLIADDIGLLLTDNATTNQLIENKETEFNKLKEEKDKEIEKLKQEKENLISVNGNLLQQVSMGKESEFTRTNEETKKKKIIDFRSGFDKSGNFSN